MINSYVYFLIGINTFRLPKEVYDSKKMSVNDLEVLVWDTPSTNHFESNDLSIDIAETFEILSMEPTLTLEESLDEDVLEYLNKLQLETLKVIKTKQVNVGSFIKCCSNLDYAQYKEQWGNYKKDILYNLSKELLTKEEFDLLKEVLL